MTARRIRSSLLSLLVAALVVACLPVAPSPPPPATPSPRGPVVAPAAAPLPGQAVVLVDSSGAQQGVASNALVVNPLALTSAADSVSVESTRNTYASAFALTPAVTANDDFVELTSSASQVDRLIYASFWAECTTGAIVTISLVQRSSLDAAGTAKTITARSQANAATTSTVQAYTSIPGSNGTLVGTIDLLLGTGPTISGIAIAPTPIVFDYRANGAGQQPPTLRANGTDALGFLFPSTACAGITFPTVILVWTEAAT